MRPTLSLLSLAAALVFQAPASAETIATKTFTYFAIGGTTAAELDAALSAKGPEMAATGTRHPGATRIKFGGTISYVRRGTRCAIGAADVTVHTRIILPRWTNRARAGNDLALVWDTLSQDIKRHEERHAEIARIHARKLEQTLLALRPEADCERMQATAPRTSETAVAEHDQDQARFDRTEAANFDRRIVRLLKYRLESMKPQQ